MLAVGWVSGPAAAQLRELEGRFVHLTTDLASNREAESLVSSFDTAVPQWADFWNLSLDGLQTWKVHACVIHDKAKFRQAGLTPDDLPDFTHGYAYGPDRVWVIAQQSEYYTRHLLLHEGVHALAISQFGWTGPTWFREGTAELLSTHHGVGKQVVINQIPRRREDVPYWGRFNLMSQMRADQQVPSLQSVMAYQPNLLGDVKSYGWSWATVMLLDAYPEYRVELLRAARFARGGPRFGGPRFNRRFSSALHESWPILAARWRLMCHDLDYGFDRDRERVALSIHDKKWRGDPMEVAVESDRGWQSVGPRIPGKVRIRVAAEGRIQLDETTQPWISEPAGITYQYYRGRPLGQLLACVLPHRMDPQATTLPDLEVTPIVGDTTIQIPEFSWLLLRVNDDVGDLENNQGVYRVNIAVQR